MCWCARDEWVDGRGRLAGTDAVTAASWLLLSVPHFTWAAVCFLRRRRPSSAEGGWNEVVVWPLRRGCCSGCACVCAGRVWRGVVERWRGGGCGLLSRSAVRVFVSIVSFFVWKLCGNGNVDCGVVPGHCWPLYCRVIWRTCEEWQKHAAMGRHFTNATGHLYCARGCYRTRGGVGARLTAPLARGSRHKHEKENFTRACRLHTTH